MTTEQKAKAYDEALERARKIHNETEFDYEKGMLGEVFPELVESEDEKIRKALINFFQRFPYCSIERAGTNTIDAITWLEKQGKKEEPQVYKTEDGEIITYSENEEYKVIKPKFNIGDWITNGRYNKLIVGINSDWPFYMFKDGTSIRIKDIDKKYHLWSIADSKDGDVLATQNYIYIFNSFDKKTETVSFYCLMKKSDEHFSFGDYKIHDEILDSIPTTKEQCDLLFQKMKEEGYEWDANNKELKKIEENSFEGDAVEKALYKVGYEWSEDTHQLKKIGPKFKVGDFS